MENTKICDLCLNQIVDDDFENLGYDKLENLKFLNLQKILNDVPMVCSKCAKNIQQSVNFKSVCLSNNEYLKTLLFPGDTGQLILEEIIMKKIKLENNYDDKKVCRFCLQYFEGTLLVELENKEQNAFLKDMLDKCLPEIDLCMTETSLMCHGCIDLLENQFKFILNCEDNELLKILKKENTDIDVNTEEYIASCVKNENENSEKIEESQYQIKVDEYLDCVQDLAMTKQYVCNKCSFVTKWKQSLNRHYIHHMKPSEINMYKCTYCPYQFKFKWDLLAHSRQHMSKEDLEKEEEARKLRRENRKNRVPTIFICEEEECSFKTNQKIFLDIHMKKHKNYEDTDTYICNECGFETKYKYHLVTHFKVHKNGKKLVKRQNIRISKQHKGNDSNNVQEPATSNTGQIYTCQTERKNFLENHFLVQESDGAKYKCSECEYVSEQICDLKEHVKTHNIPLFVTTYICTECPYQTKYKMSFIFHSQKHTSETLVIENNTDNSKLETVQCTVCDYRTGYVSNLKRHYRLKHKNDLLDESYSCLECDYKTKFEFEMETHRKIHKPIYKCDKCDYVTKMGHHFRDHTKTHMKLSEVDTFTCHVCGFVTKFKKNIIAHIKTH